MRTFPKDTLAERAARLAPYYTTILPNGNGPFPTGMMFHGCGSARGPQIDYARAAAKRGIASVIVDSYAPRDIGATEAQALVCFGWRLWGRERAGDVLASLYWMKRQPWALSDRVVAAGWSHGAWTIMDALALGSGVADHANLTELPEDPLEGLTAAFLVYPWCGPAAQTNSRGWRKPVSALMILAEKDSVSGVRLPLKAAEMARRSGSTVETIIYPQATHSFDERRSINPTFEYSPDLTQRAIDTYASWASRQLAPVMADDSDGIVAIL